MIVQLFANGSDLALDFDEDDEVNFVNRPSEPLSINIYGHIHTFILIVVNSAVIWYLLKLKSTFLNYLVLLDCCNAIAHASFLIQGHFRIMETVVLCFVEEGFNVFISGMNRGITVTIALYRYCLIFRPYSYMEVSSMKDLQNKMLSTTFGYGMFNLMIYAGNKENNRRYLTCMGREERYLYNLQDFDASKFTAPINNFPLSSPLRWLQWLMFYSPVIIVPICYTRIYLYRHRMVTPGERTAKGLQADLKKKKRNAVTFKYNMFIWLSETMAVFIPLVFLAVDTDQEPWTLLPYMMISLGLSPTLYLLGMRE